tara:strand:+ start:73 stop:291 length:219 start_codon:yes stop_codon:yes gene_type:complete
VETENLDTLEVVGLCERCSKGAKEGFHCPLAEGLAFKILLGVIDPNCLLELLELAFNTCEETLAMLGELATA